MKGEHSKSEDSAISINNLDCSGVTNCVNQGILNYIVLSEGSISIIPRKLILSLHDALNLNCVRIEYSLLVSISIVGSKT